MLQDIIQKGIQEAVKQAASKAVEKAVEIRAKKTARQDGKEWRGNFHYLVSGYYTGLGMFYTSIPFTVIMIICSIGTWNTGERTYTVIFMALTAAFDIAACAARSKMRVIVYWNGGLMFLDRKGNILVQMPSSALRDAVVRWNRIRFVWDERTYVIWRNRDNEREVREMLAFFRAYRINAKNL